MRPSQLAGIEDDYTAFQFDHAVAIQAIDQEGELAQQRYDNLMVVLEGLAAKWGIKFKKKPKAAQPNKEVKPIDTSNMSVEQAIAIHGGAGVIVNG